jgi:hypothetical protein
MAAVLAAAVEYFLVGVPPMMPVVEGAVRLQPVVEVEALEEEMVVLV